MTSHAPTARETAGADWISSGCSLPASAAEVLTCPTTTSRHDDARYPVPVDGLILIAAGLMVIGVLFVGTSERLRVPAALISLGIGIVFGSDVLGVVDLDDMALVRT